MLQDDSSFVAFAYALLPFVLNARALYPTNVAAPKGVPARGTGLVIRNQTGWVSCSRHQEWRNGAAPLSE